MNETPPGNDKSGDFLPIWHPAWLTATWFGVGKMPIASGTWGSLAALPGGWLIFQAWGSAGLATAIVAVFGAGLWASGRYIRHSGDGDPSAVVVDEVAGQWIAMLPVLSEPILLIPAFFVFRFFDILKPFPVGWSERYFKGAFGVMIDDVLAGAYAALVGVLLLKIGGPWLGGWNGG